MLTMLCFVFAGWNGYYLMLAGWHVTPDLYWNAVVGGLCLLYGGVRLIKGQ